MPTTGECSTPGDTNNAACSASMSSGTFGTVTHALMESQKPRFGAAFFAILRDYCASYTASAAANCVYASDGAVLRNAW
ncbi:hypothetical protein SAMN05192541_1773 [Bradyrhizobium arachidis]|nr:hypothetical protein SAMN05192541_1773 [Bradyrhizobium arachidis]